jgi:uncharacterized protein YfdQ (DUF2303 family)
MDRDAIELIQQHQSIESAAGVLNEVLAADREVGAIPLIALPHNMSLASLENYLPNPVRFRGKYQTSDIGEFIAYVKENTVEGAPSQVFIDSVHMCAVALFDLGTVEEPGFNQHRAVLTLKGTSAAQALREIDGNTASQRALAEWLEDWRENIGILHDDLSEAEFISMVRSITLEGQRKSISQIGDYSAAQSEFESVEANSGDKPLPNKFMFNCKHYLGLPEMLTCVRLRLKNLDDKDSRKPMFALRIVEPERNKEEASKVFCETLKGELLDCSTVRIGEFDNH